MNIMRNDVFDMTEPREDTVRVLFQLENDDIVVISLIKKDSLPYEISAQLFREEFKNGNITKNTDHPTPYYPEPTVKQQEAAEKAWKIIGTFVQDEPDCYDRKVRSRFIAAKSRELGIDRRQITRLLYRYYAGGMTRQALYPDFVGRGGAGKNRDVKKILGRPITRDTPREQIIIGENELKQIEKVVKIYYNKNTKYRYTYAYNQLIKEFYTDSETGLVVPAHPSWNQFYFHAQKFVDPKKRHGGIIFNKDMRGITGSSMSDVSGPGDMYQIDATLGDVYLVSHYDRNEIVGRPELYFVTDVFSRMIVGFYTCLESASWENARHALLNTFSDKGEVFKRYGMPFKSSDWPCSGLPRALLVDNGELISRASNAIIENLGITVSNTAAYRPDLKGIIESRFRLLNIAEKARLPGAVLKDFRQRGGHDYRLDAKLNLTEFTQVIIHFILNHNKKMMSEHPYATPDILSAHVPAIPIDLWNWGLTHRTGALRTMDTQDLSIALSERADATVTSRGIKFHGLYYTCESAQKENWFSTARTGSSRKITVAFNPRNMDNIYYINGASGYEICSKTSACQEFYQGLSLEEISWWSDQRKKQEASYELEKRQNEVDHISAVDSIVSAAEEKKSTYSVVG